MNKNHCIICENLIYDEICNFGDFPYFTAPVKYQQKKEILQKYKSSDIESELSYMACGYCGHIYIKNMPNQEVINQLYDQYYTYPSPMLKSFSPTRDNTFLDYFEKHVIELCDKNQLNSVFEVGCYDGYILSQLKKKGFNVSGCDPSNGADIGISFGIDIIKDFFNHKLIKETNGSIDILISRHFIEHVQNPKSYLLEFSKVIQEKGLIILETPNISYFLERGLPSVFSLQHISLFTSCSFLMLLQDCGFEPILRFETPDNLILVAKKKCDHKIIPKSLSKDGIKLIRENFAIKIKKNKIKIEETLKNFDKIAVWGAGGAGIAFLKLYNIKIEKIVCFIDSDPKKWECEYINYSVDIVSPSNAEKYSPSIIVIASMYQDSILKEMPVCLNKIPKLLLSRDVNYIT